MVIIIDATLPPDQAEKIQQLSCAIQLVRMPTVGGALPKDALREAEIIYTAAANFNPADAPRLRWVQVNTAAIEHFAERPVMRTAIPVANVTGAYTTAVAECALAMLLAVTRRIPLGCQFQARHEWPEDYEPWRGDDLYSQTMGMVGYGSIGRQIARIVQAMGMNVLACKRNPAVHGDASYALPDTGDPDGDIPTAWFGFGQLRDMLRQSDVAMITLPQTPETRGMIGRAELDALPHHAYVVNMGRGRVVDETALLDSLRSGRLAGAAFDVFAEEPLPAADPLWTAPNLLIMPHIGSWTKLQERRATEVFIENLQRDLRGDPLVNVVDKKLMY